MSNIERIELEAKLRLPSSSKQINPDFANRIQISVLKKEEAAVSEMHAEKTAIGVGRTLDTEFIKFLITLPVSEYEFDQEARAYVEDLYIKTSDPKMKKRLKEKQSEFISGLKKLYFKNEVGQYEISCAYSCMGKGDCVGTLNSISEVFVVVEKGSLSDQINRGFRKDKE